MLSNPACPSTTGVLLLLSTSTITMEAGASSMAIEIFSQASHKFKHCSVSDFDHHAYKSEQRREVIKRVNVFLKKIQSPKPLF